MSLQATLVVNGAVVAVDVTATDPVHTPLSRFLRDRGLTGTKEGCAEGDCGACSLAVADVDTDGKPTWRAVTSCIAPLGAFIGREIVTAEGLADDGGGLHPVQAAMVRHLGSQCGYCTPGFVTAMFEGYERDGVTVDDPAAFADQLAGNLCRCTGYRPIRDAMCHALRVRDAGVVDDELVAIGGSSSCGKRGHHSVASTTAIDVDVQGPRGRLVRPTSLSALLQLKHDTKGMLLGGATELGVLLRKRDASWPLLIDTAAVAELQQLGRADVRADVTGVDVDCDGDVDLEAFADCWVVGGAVTLAKLEEALLVDSGMAPVVRLLRVFASRQIKNAATLAGNIVTASPIGDMAPVLLALGAVLESRSPTTRRVVPLSSFFVGYRKTLLRDDEVVTRFFIPRPADSATLRTFKVSKRRELDIAIVSAAFIVDVDSNDVVTNARFGFGGVAATPVLSTAAAAALIGRTVADARHDVKAALASAFSPLSDVRAGADYRRGLITSLWDRFVDDVNDEAHDGDQLFEQEGAWAIDDATRALLHESGTGHVTGRSRYVDDLPHTKALEVWPVQSRVARGTLRVLNVDAARALPGVRDVITAAEIPGHNDVGAIRKDEVLLVPLGAEVQHEGQLLAFVVADTVEHAKAGAAAVVVEIDPLPATIGIAAALREQSFHTRLDGLATPHTMRKGDIVSGLGNAKHRLSFSVDIGGQEHFYLETHAAFAEPGDEGDVTVWSSTQHPSEVQAVVAHVLHVPRHRVVITSPRMGGGFGGKETQANAPAALVALAALRTNKPVRLMWDRDVDMRLTGKRHPFFARCEVGFDDDGVVSALRAEIYSDGGFALDLSESIHDRALFHADNCYDIANVELSGRVCKTNVVSHTAFRGFGGPQGMVVVEDAMTRVAQHLGIGGDIVRARNFYAGKEAAVYGRTPYGQVVDDCRIGRIWPLLHGQAEYDVRRQQVDAFNAGNVHVKRGLAITPVKFGISFTASFLNQAGALVVIYRDGSVQVNHGGTEMGQGLNTKILGITMRELGVQRSHVRVMPTRTDKVPNTSATAASSGADLNGAAVAAALSTLKDRLRPVAASLLTAQRGAPVDIDAIHFTGGVVKAAATDTSGIDFAVVCEAAYLRQISLSSTGYYRTPDIGYDKKSAHGNPFHYFAYGACVAEVELDGTTGMRRVRRVDVLHDVGDSLNPAIDRGQVEGALVQGIGWLTGEELKWDAQGRLLSHSASTYQIPSFSDAPAVMKIALYDDVVDDAAQPDVVHGSKAVGEPPLMLALSVREALKDALAAFSDVDNVVVDVPSPLTHEVLFHAVQQLRGA